MANALLEKIKDLLNPEGDGEISADRKLFSIEELFEVQKAAISKHLKNIFASGELMEDSVVSVLETACNLPAQTCRRQLCLRL